MSAYLRALRFALSRQASAYGFTLTVWGAGALAIERLGGPDPAEVFAFVGGALVAAVIIVALAFGAWNTLRAGEPRRRSYSAMHLPSVPVAVAGGWGVTLVLGGPAGYFTAAFVAVCLYESLLSAEIGLALIEPARERRRRRRSPPLEDARAGDAP